MNIELGRDACEDMLEYSEDFQIIDAAIASAIPFDDELTDETELFNMTSLGTLIFLEQRSTRNKETSYDTYLQSIDEDKRLTLAYERLRTIPRPLVDRFALAVHTLDISHNEFNNLEFLDEFKYLSSLVADHNNITTETTLPYMPQLELLWLNHCKINELFPWIRRLRHSCPNLRHISLMGNPAAPSYLNGGAFYDYVEYRLFMISFFPKLVHLDDRPVTDEQRVEAERLYKNKTLFKRIETQTLNVLPSYIRDRASIFLQSTNRLTNLNQRSIKNSII